MKKIRIGWFFELLYHIRYFKTTITYLPKEIKYIIQRIKYGISDKDVWNLDQHLADVILRGLLWFEKFGHSDFDGTELNDMIEGFTLLKKCSDGEELEWGMKFRDEDRKKINEAWKNEDIRLTTKEEEQKISKAFDLLKKNFWKLWD